MSESNRYRELGCSQEEHLPNCSHFGESGAYLSEHSAVCKQSSGGGRKSPCICNPKARAKTKTSTQPDPPSAGATPAQPFKCKHGLTTAEWCIECHKAHVESKATPAQLPTIAEMSGGIAGDLLDYEGCGMTRPNTPERTAVEAGATSASEPPKWVMAAAEDIERNWYSYCGHAVAETAERIWRHCRGVVPTPAAPPTPEPTVEQIVQRWTNCPDGCLTPFAAASAIREALASSSERVRELEQELRYMMWVSHGHDGLYGDDGEMQCCRCRPLDYKRAPLNEVREAYRLARLEFATAALLAQIGKAPK